MLEFSFILEVRIKERALLDDSLNKIFSRKKLHGCTMKKAADMLKCSEKEVLGKCIKVVTKRRSLK